MELGLSLGEASRPTFALAGKTSNKGLGFCMSLGVVNGFSNTSNNESSEENKADEERDVNGGTTTTRLDKSDEEDGKLERNPPVHELHLLPLDPVKTANSSQPVFPWPPPSDHYGNSEAVSSGHLGLSARGFDVNRLPSAEYADDGAAVSSPNSTVSSFQRDFSIYSGGSGGSKRDAEAAGLNEAEAERASSRASDEEENGLTRKKLRLSKEQSAFLEESFKEHNTLNPKQKVALAKRLNLRARQVEVWFQNRRARTKLKQTEVDCEYLKRCCETLTEENRRLQKELQELRALKTSHPYYTQLPATTLTMCPSCERTTTTKTGDAFSLNNNNNNKQPRFYPFSQPHLHQSSAAS